MFLAAKKYQEKKKLTIDVISNNIIWVKVHVSYYVVSKIVIIMFDEFKFHTF